MEKKEIICPICDSVDSIFFTNKKGYDLYKCISCKLLFTFPVPDSSKVYDDSYFSGAEKGFGYVDYDLDKEPMTPTFNKYLDLLSGFGKTNGDLLDIGCATGFFIKLAKNKGFKVIGIEFSDYAAKKGRDSGLNVITGD